MSALEIARLPVSYCVKGSGPALVLLHHLGGSRAVWQPQVDAMSPTHRVIVIEFSGHGETLPSTPLPNFDQMVNDVLAVMDRENIASATVAGVSLGGMVALRLAAAHPDRVAALLLISTDPRPPAWRSRLKLGLLRIAVRLLGRRALRNAAKSYLGATSLRERGHLVARISADLMAVHLRSLRAMARMLARRTRIAGITKFVTMPVTIMFGTEDRSLPPVRATALLAELPNAKAIELADVGHLAPLEAPAAVTAELAALAAFGNAKNQKGRR